MARRVVITGIGLITPIGVGNDATWSSVCEGVGGVGRISTFDPSDLKTQIAGEVKDFDPTLYMEPKDAKRNDRFIQLSIAATMLALRDAGLEITDDISERTGTFIGSGIGGMKTFYDTVLTMENKGPSRVSPFFIPNIVTNMASGYVSIKFNAKGPNCSSTTACSASGHSLALSAKIIKDGKADVMIAGGSEAPLIPLTFAAFNAMRALSTRNDEPETASRPFEAGRDGFILSEGAGMLILEELEFAKKRGASIYAEVLGSGMSADAFHITAPSLEGPSSCMSAALEDSGLNPGDVDYINAHGTSTRLNDVNETKAIKNVFGEDASANSGEFHQIHDRSHARRRRCGGGGYLRARASKRRFAADDKPFRKRSGVRPGLRSPHREGKQDKSGAQQFLRFRGNERKRCAS